ncbi:hypothetical protein RUMTOR_01787 [[Ruminococcus] torques ATCC 27756]|uniref:Uncharacterized protein n=1 Tax=[Ruminococcus] torques ATCC 27756 TaxID=411460 RepID=A5KNG2_9FIRM|nr:hypothetical protein RUMTOR_01787 [[Ruminococcus] torques ATCC 27756]
MPETWRPFTTSECGFWRFRLFAGGKETITYGMEQAAFDKT